MQSAVSRLHAIVPKAASRFLALPALLIAFLSCSPQNNGSQDTLFHVINYPPFSSLDPATEQSDGVNILHNVYETLTIYDNRDGQIKPCLAESWTSNATMTEWTFTLRRDVLFHDGNPLTAAAVKKSIDRVMFLGKNSSYLWDCVSSIEAKNMNTVIFRLNYAANLPLIASSGSAAYIISPAATSKDEAWFSVGNDAGSGPYRIASVSKNSVALEAFDGYRDGWAKGKYKKIFISEIPTIERRTGYMKSGDADIVFFPDQISGESLGNYALEIIPSWQSLVMFFNTQKDPCSSEDFRKALAYAFPYEETANRILKGQVSPAKGIVPSGLWPHDASLPSYSCDLDKARDYLARSNFTDGFLILSYHSSRNELDEILELYRKNLDTIGVNLILMKTDWESQKQVATNPNPNDRQDIMLMNWWPDYADPAGIFKLLLSDLGLNRGYNYSYLRDAEISLAIQIASILTLDDKDEATKIYRSLQQKVYDRCNLVFLYDSAIPVAYKKGISGLRINPAYGTCIYYYDLHR